MKRMSLALTIALGSAFMTQQARADGPRQPLSVQPIAFSYDYYADETESSPSDQVPEAADVPYGEGSAVPVPDVPMAGSSVYMGAGACGCGACGGCDACCGTRGGLLGNCCLGEPWSLWGSRFQNCEPWMNVGGWASIGYHDDSTGLFNRHPGRFHLHQGYVWLEKEAERNPCYWDWGFRADFIYGVDAQDTQAFGNPPGTWDFQNGFDHGIYGWAIPQLYAEVARGDLSIKLGHFYTIIGYETVTAPDNFFYSHSFTMFASEPFTHTGVLANYRVSENLDTFAGWTLGWDTGFEQNHIEPGNSYLTGFTAQLTDNTSLTYSTILGNFGWRGDDGWMHSLILTSELTDRMTYVFWHDWLRVDHDDPDNPAGVGREQTVGINQYLIYRINDCLSIGNRIEWWKAEQLTPLFADPQVIPLFADGGIPANSAFSIYQYTFGLNVRPHANLVFRPEIRQQWAPAVDYDETIFGFDVITTF